MSKLITPSRKLVSPADAGGPWWAKPGPVRRPWWSLSKGLLKGCCCGPTFECKKVGNPNVPDCCFSTNSIADVAWSITDADSGTCCAEASSGSASLPINGSGVFVLEYDSGGCTIRLEVTKPVAAYEWKLAITRVSSGGNTGLYDNISGIDDCCGFASNTNTSINATAFASCGSSSTVVDWSLSFRNNFCCNDDGVCGAAGQDYANNCDASGNHTCVPEEI